MQAQAEKPKPVLPSPAPITNPSRSDIRYAQHTLNALGFKVGLVDGIWGPRSARSIRNFERKYGLQSANGLLSELNLYMLETISSTSRTAGKVPVPQKPAGIAAKLDNETPLSEAPQLIILDRPYTILAKPNPFSEALAELPVGTGIYVINLQDGWFEVESESQQRGFIQAD